MRVGFYTVFRRDPQHFLHAQALVASVRMALPGVEIAQFTDEHTPIVEGVTHVRRRPDGPMLERRLEHYAACEGEWLFVDTDTLVVQDVRAVFHDEVFDVALADRAWKGMPQGDDTMHTMPFNSGVVFSRSSRFWNRVLDKWRDFPKDQRDWMSEQRAVYQVIRSGHYRVRILSGEVYNYPPRKKHNPCTGAAIVHFKGAQRKQWLSEQIVESWRVMPMTPEKRECASV